ncbi:MAG: DUF2130 domain-containing protein [Patescibacteria group bacterium]
MDKKHSSEIEEIKKKALEEAGSKSEETLKKIREESEADKKEMREQIKGLFDQIRELTKAKDNAEIEAEKKLLEKEKQIREEAEKNADEKQRLNLAAKNKTITDLQKALDDAQRKAAQGSQQLQGEIMELDFEKSLADAFRDDDIEPVAKGVKGGDIRQVVKSPRGTVCGAMLWEIKRTKNWTDGWIAKLKEDLRTAKANIPIIITEAMPKEIAHDIAQFNSVWVCKPKMAIILATLLRKSLLDAGYQKALAENRGGKADLLYNFVTSHEFVQQVEGMVETYKEMTVQVVKERAAFEKLWAQREKQAQKLLLGTANIIGSMQGHIGQASMPKIKGLELTDDDECEQLLLR